MAAQCGEVANRILLIGEIFSMALHFAASQALHDMFVAT
jgi:hypothetical protein